MRIRHTALLAGLISLLVLSQAGAEEKQMTSIPFAKSLRRADVAVATMKDGQRESLILGNGDLYGIVWEKDNGLFVRITHIEKYTNHEKGSKRSRRPNETRK